MTTKPQRIIKLEVEDFLRVKAATITPDGKAVVIGGDNAEGKSSILFAIQALFGGKKNTPSEPVRQGAKKATIIGETTDYIVEKRIKKGGDAEVEVRSKDGAIIPRPHELLSKLYDEMTFDPCAFDRMDPKEQSRVIRDIANLDFTKLDADHAAKYAARTEVGRELKRLQGALDSMAEAPAGTPDTEVSVAELVAEAERRQKVNTANAAKRAELEAKRADGKRLVAEVADAKAKLDELDMKLNALRTEGRALAAEVEKLVDTDVDEVRKQLATAEQTNAAVRSKSARAKLEAELDAKTEESEHLTQNLAEIDEVKATAIASAKYPIEGLTVTDEGVRLKGLPYKQASQAERLRASTAIGAALKKGLRCMLIREGAFLDTKGMAMLLGPIAEEFDLQPIVEVVGDRKEVTVLMSDGEVAEDRTASETKGAA